MKVSLKKMFATLASMVKKGQGSEPETIALAKEADRIMHEKAVTKRIKTVKVSKRKKK